LDSAGSAEGLDSEGGETIAGVKGHWEVIKNINNE